MDIPTDEQLSQLQFKVIKRRCKECGLWFDVKQKTQLFCCKTHYYRFHAKEQRRRDPQKVYARQLRWRRENPEKYHKYCNDYWHKVRYPKDKEKIIARNRDYVKRNKEKVRAYMKAYREMQKSSGLRNGLKPPRGSNLENNERIMRAIKWEGGRILMVWSGYHDTARKYYRYLCEKDGKVILRSDKFSKRKDCVKDVKECFEDVSIKDWH